LGERPARTGRLGADHPRLAHHHLDRIPTTGEGGNVLARPGMDPGREHSASRTCLVPRAGLDHHPPPSQGQVDSVDHVVSGQVEYDAGSVTPIARLRAHMLDHGSCPSEAGCLTTPILSKGTSHLASRHDHAQLRRARFLVATAWTGADTTGLPQ